MNVIAKLTLKHLSRNMKRTVVTILGIATSTALISAILLGVYSFFRYFGTVSIQTDGNAQAAFYEITEDQARSLKSDERIEIAGVTDTDPVISGVRVPGEKEDRFRLGNIAWGDTDYYAQMVVSYYEGTLPSNSSEIAVEEKFLSDNGLDLKVGDKLTFELGNRHYYENGEIVYLAGSYRSEEEFDSLKTETCTITAILHGNRPTAGFDILRGMDEDCFPKLKNSQIRICLKNSDHTSIRQIKEIINDYGIGKYELNTEYLISVFAFEGSVGSYRALFVIMGIALCVVIVTSVVLIVNSIGMSLAEKLRYLGMLASVGATARQKRMSIYFEGLILGAIGIPLGILIGYIGTGITLFALGHRIVEANIIAGTEGMSGSIPVVCSPSVIVFIVFCAALTIFISTLIPAVKAAKVMPIDALRQANTIKVKPGRLRVPGFIRRIFGYEGELAYKNIKRNGIKGTVITISIAASVIMFITVSFFIDSMKRVNQFDFDFPGQIVVSVQLDQGERLRESLEKTEGVERVFTAGTIQFWFEKKETDTFETANKDIINPEFLTPDYKNLNLSSISLTLIDDEDFIKLLNDNGLSKEKYFGSELRGVLLNNLFHDRKSGEVFNEGVIGQRLHYDETEGFPPAVEIGDFVKYDENNYVFHLTPKGTVTVYAPASMYYDKAKETIGADILTIDYCVVTPDHQEVSQKIYELLEAEDYNSYSVSDLTDSLAVMNTITLLIKTPMYGFTILLTLIAIANIVNTISTGILLRRKEFAMFKSVGMASGGFKKMIRLETILYGVRALVIGIPASLLLSFLMYSAFDKELYTFRPNPIIYLAVIAAVFAVVGLSMLLSVNKLKDDSIIEALKYETA